MVNIPFVPWMVWAWIFYTNKLVRHAHHAMFGRIEVSMLISSPHGLSPWEYRYTKNVAEYVFSILSVDFT